MSTKAKLTLGCSILFTTSLISYIHFNHYKEREEVKGGVRKFQEKEAKRKENLALYDENEKFIKAMKEAEAKQQT